VRKYDGIGIDMGLRGPCKIQNEPAHLSGF
jgi:hypothetical protein